MIYNRIFEKANCEFYQIPLLITNSDLPQKLAQRQHMTEKKISSSAERIETSASTVEEAADVVEQAADVVQQAAQKVETNVTEGIQPDINELRIYMGELNEAANIRQKRLLWAGFVLIAINLLTLLVVLIK